MCARTCLDAHPLLRKVSPLCCSRSSAEGGAGWPSGGCGVHTGQRLHVWARHMRQLAPLPKEHGSDSDGYGSRERRCHPGEFFLSCEWIAVAHDRGSGLKRQNQGRTRVGLQTDTMGAMGVAPDATAPLYLPGSFSEIAPLVGLAGVTATALAGLAFMAKTRKVPRRFMGGQPTLYW